MNEAEQKAGEKRVRDHLIDPLLHLGLTKPGAMRKDQFADMLRHLEQTLAYMGADDLVDLKDRAAEHPGGKERDRFPLAVNILKWAKEVKPPQKGDASPFIRRVMASVAGQAALDRGYAPELLDHIRAHRGEWPGAWTLSQLRDRADDVRRRFEDLLMRQERGDELAPDDLNFIAARQARIDECRRVRELGLAGEGA